ncbi:MAG: hypothetical protein UY09_C0014G0005 [Parcubacteria group bacterium GW2011_GWA2_47_8]|nr:MAG: hypothetical protein UY09_C0014G0005 [Parcubacteria group bacterium GW2011_GWA2_47_8]
MIQLYVMVAVFQTKMLKLRGTNYSEVMDNARRIFREIERKTKRHPYIRSPYFNKEKIFFDLFWSHLHEKKAKERYKRLKYFAAALELLRLNRNPPSSKPNPNKRTEILHRFTGMTKEKEIFYVQVKENTKTHKKYFMSCFPDEKK